MSNPSTPERSLQVFNSPGRSCASLYALLQSPGGSSLGDTTLPNLPSTTHNGSPAFFGHTGTGLGQHSTVATSSINSSIPTHAENNVDVKAFLTGIPDGCVEEQLLAQPAGSLPSLEDLKAATFNYPLNSYLCMPLTNCADLSVSWEDELDTWNREVAVLDGSNGQVQLLITREFKERQELRDSQARLDAAKKDHATKEAKWKSTSKRRDQKQHNLTTLRIERFKLRKLLIDYLKSIEPKSMPFGSAPTNNSTGKEADPLHIEVIRAAVGCEDRATVYEYKATELMRILYVLLFQGYATHPFFVGLWSMPIPGWHDSNYGNHPELKTGRATVMELGKRVADYLGLPPLPAVPAPRAFALSAGPGAAVAPGASDVPAAVSFEVLKREDG